MRNAIVVLVGVLLVVTGVVAICAAGTTAASETVGVSETDENGDPTWANDTANGNPHSRSSEGRSLAPSITITSVDNPGTVEVGSELGSDSTSIGITVENTGDTPETIQSIDFEAGSGEIDETKSGSGTIQPGNTADISTRLTVPDDTSANTYTLDVTVNTNGTSDTDSSQTITVERPPVLGVTSTTLENVTAGSTTEFELTIEELNDAEDDPTVSHTVSSPSGTSLSFPDNDVDGSLSAGGSRTVAAEITVDGDLDGNQTLSWDLTLSNDGENEQTSSISAPVRIPARFSLVSIPDDAIRFDEPKDETDTIEQRVPVKVENNGDFNLTLTNLDASFADTRITVTDVSLNGTAELTGLGTIPPRTTGVVDVEVRAENIMPEQESVLNLNFEGTGAAGRSPDPFQEERTLRIVHVRKLVLDRESIDFGQQPPREIVRQEVELKETLGYKDLSGITVEQTSGPENGWLTVTEVPETVEAGGTDTMVFELRFSRDVEPQTSFAWNHTLNADGVDPISIESRAKSRVAGLEDVRSNLTRYRSVEGKRGEIATGMLNLIDEVKGSVEDGSVSPVALSTTLTASTSLLEMLRALEETQRIVENDSLSRGKAQENVIRAAASYNTFRFFVESYEEERFKTAARDVRDRAGEEINTTVTEQKQYFQGRLPEGEETCGESDRITCREEAEIKRQLSQLALLEGNTEESQRLDQEADEAFDTYTSLVNDAQNNYQSAQQRRDRIKEEYAVVAFGQPLVLNPLDYGSFITEQRSALEDYDNAQSAFTQAGANQLADTVQNERVGADRELEVARTSMFIALIVYGLISLWLVFHVASGIYDFRHDTRTTEADDFLV
jgi:hypothetical protein